MQITEIRPEVTYKKPKQCCAIYTVTLDNELVIRSVKVMRGKAGYYVAFPYIGCTIENGKRHFVDAVHPNSPELRKQMSDRIIQEYLDTL